MSIMTEDTVPRDQYGRPLITPADGGDPVPYTRVSTLAKMLDDTSGLEKWKTRQTIHGLTLRADLWALAQAARGNHQKLGDLVKQAEDAAGSRSGANVGTALHAWAELVDGGEVTIEEVPAGERADVAAYLTTIHENGLTPVLREQFVVCDEIQSAGTFDAVYLTDDGRYVIGDLKTGARADEYPHSVTMQCAIYAHGKPYTPSGGRSAHPFELDLTVGVLIHVPAGRGIGSAHWLDLEDGWEAAMVGAWVREWRRRKPIALWGDRLSDGR